MVSIRVRRNDVYQTVINVFYFVLLFASNIFYPLEPMPAWLKGVAMANPITWQVDLLRYATVDLSSGLSLWLETGTVRSVHRGVIRLGHANLGEA